MNVEHLFFQFILLIRKFNKFSKHFRSVMQRLCDNNTHYHLSGFNTRFPRANSVDPDQPASEEAGCQIRIPLFTM